MTWTNHNPPSGRTVLKATIGSEMPQRLILQSTNGETAVAGRVAPGVVSVFRPAGMRDYPSLYTDAK